MRERTRFLPSIVAALCLLLIGSTAWAVTVPPRPERGVSDTAGVLTPAQRDALERKIVNFHEKNGPSIAVALVPSLEGESIKEASYEIANTWKVGNEGRSDGVLFLVGVAEAKKAGPRAKKCGCIRIEVGSYLEGDLTDTDSRKILKKAGPVVVTGDFNKAVNIAVDGIMAEVGKTKTGAGAGATRSGRSSSSADDAAAGWIFGVIGAIFGIGLIAWMFRPRYSSRSYSYDDEPYVPPRRSSYTPPSRTSSSSSSRRRTSSRSSSSSYTPPPVYTPPSRSSYDDDDDDDSFKFGGGFGGFGGSDDSGGGSIDFGGDFGGGGDDW